MATVERENIAPLTDRLTVKLKIEDYLPPFEKKLKEYGKNANIPGFRKGHVPPGMIKKMYGQGIFADEVLRTVEKELNNWLVKERPNIFAQPLPAETNMQQPDMSNPGDFSLDFEIGLQPEFSLPNLSDTSLTKNKVEVTDEMVTEEINRMRKNAGKFFEKESIENDNHSIDVLIPTAENDVAAEPTEGSLNMNWFTQGFKESLKGKKPGDSFSFDFDNDIEEPSKKAVLNILGFAKTPEAAAGKHFNAEIKSVKTQEDRELNEEFFNEVYPNKGITSEEELRSALKAEVEKYWDSQSRNQFHDQLYHYLLDETKMEFPRPFLTRWLKTGGDKERSAEEAEKEYPTFENQLKWTLINDRLMRENKLEVTDEEIREDFKKDLMNYFGQMNLDSDMTWLDSYLDKMMKDEKQIDQTHRKLSAEKLFDWAEAQVKPAEVSVSAEQFAKMQHQH